MASAQSYCNWGLISSGVASTSVLPAPIASGGGASSKAATTDFMSLFDVLRRDISPHSYRKYLARRTKFMMSLPSCAKAYTGTAYEGGHQRSWLMRTLVASAVLKSYPVLVVGLG